MTEAMMEHDFTQRDDDELAADHLVRPNDSLCIVGVDLSDPPLQAMYGLSSEGPSDDQARSDPSVVQLKVS